MARKRVVRYGQHELEIPDHGRSDRRLDARKPHSGALGRGLVLDVVCVPGHDRRAGRNLGGLQTLQTLKLCVEPSPENAGGRRSRISSGPAVVRDAEATAPAVADPRARTGRVRGRPVDRGAGEIPRLRSRWSWSNILGERSRHAKRTQFSKGCAGREFRRQRPPGPIGRQAGSNGRTENQGFY